VKSKQRESTPVVVRKANRAGEAHSRWRWVEPEVWTDRMLAALEKGVKGGRWYSLMDKVASERTLRLAFLRVKKNRGSAGVDHISVEQYERRLEENLGQLAEKLRSGTYRPQAIRRHWIEKPGSREKRPLGIPTVQDRVVQTAMRLVLEPIFERDFAANSYGFRPGRSCHGALDQVQRALDSGKVWVVDADFEQYFDSIPREELLQAVSSKVTDQSLLALLRAYLEQKVMEGLEEWNPIKGTPQGAVISPLLANIYLDPLDHEMADEGFQMVRYADDLVILCSSQEAAETALGRLRQWAKRAGLSLHPEKTRIVDASQRGGFDFLGYHFERGWRWPRQKSLKAFKDRVRLLTRRANGCGLAQITAKLNPILRGWFEYFKLSYKTLFKELDGWIRMRLRSVQRKHEGRKGRGGGTDHNRLPNAFFAKLGLFSLLQARESFSQSSPR
jgi:RNA-directed DNA polymerase